jgi:hypothetical protein
MPLAVSIASFNRVGNAPRWSSNAQPKAPAALNADRTRDG